jgi:hypothetical protein
MEKKDGSRCDERAKIFECLRWLGLINLKVCALSASSNALWVAQRDG